MIQLKVYDSPAKETQYWLDLYESEPIKLTLSIEDLTNADATSTFSRAFKVPGTRKNAEFFKNAFDIDGTLFDVTIKKPAEILVDGAEFKQGHVRLQKIFTNTEQDRYDYELLFLGETRDFSSKIGDKGLCQLVMPDLVGGISGETITATDVIFSWNAWDGTNGALNSGLHDGNIIYPLIDHGNTYSSSGSFYQGATQTMIDVTYTGTPPDRTPGTFLHSTTPLFYDRLKPMIRARRILQQIFEDAGYTWKPGGFFDSEMFHQIYISAFGNNATVGWDNDQASSPNSDNICHAEAFGSEIEGQILFNNVNDPGGNLSVLTSTVYGPMTVYQLSGTGDYQIEASATYSGYSENSNGTYNQVDAELRLYNMSVSPPALLAFSGYGSGTLQLSTTVNVPADAASSHKIGLVVWPQYGVDQTSVTNVVFDVLSAPGQFNPVSSLECTYKQIDFVKDILTAFRLVLAPDPVNPTQFIIEPWQTYINSGELYDWSKKLVENKEVVSEPVFFSQSDVIDFKFQPDGDYTNVYHLQAYSQPYGWLQFDSNNELLKGQREIKLLGIAPTEMLQIEGADGSNFILPLLHTHSPQGAITQHLPIKTKTRMLFYNGKKTITNSDYHWYLDQGGTPTLQSQYPLVSPYQEWPIQPGTLNLNWANDVQYWGEVANYNQKGSTLYSDYWSRYIESLYNKYARRVTAYFVLNNIDLNTFSFDDTIFVNGTYYRPERIVDVEVGDYTEVQVQLLTANDYRPSIVPGQTLFDVTAVGQSGGCVSNNGSILVTAAGTPGYTWQLSNGMSGTALNGTAPGQPSYSFTISNVPPGNYTLVVTDSLTRTDTVTVSVPIGFESLPSATFTVTNATDCITPCNGQVEVTAQGTGPLTIHWDDGTSITDPTAPYVFLKDALCAGQLSFYIEDANGCLSPSYLVNVECEQAGGTVWNYAKDLNCQALSSQFYKVFVPTGTTPQPGIDYVTLGAYEVAPPEGCFVPVNETTGTPDYFIDQYYQNCSLCQNEQRVGYYYSIAEYEPAGGCVVGSTLNQAVFSPGPIAIGSTVNLTNITSPFLFPNTCYEIVYEIPYTIPTEADVASIYVNCESCQTPQTGSNLLIEDCTTGEAWVLPNTYSMLIGDTVQYVKDSEPGSVYCGTVYSTTSTLPTDATLYSGRRVNCDSARDCNFSPMPTEYYTIQECGTDYVWTAEKGLFNFSIGDVVQFRFLPDIALYCGTITNIVTSGTPDIIITEPYSIPGCDDTLHCFQ